MEGWRVHGEDGGGEGTPASNRFGETQVALSRRVSSIKFKLREQEGARVADTHQWRGDFELAYGLGFLRQKERVMSGKEQRQQII